MSLAPQLLAILACPEDRGPLVYIESENLLYNPRTSRCYAVLDGIPVMLIEESLVVEGDERARLEAVIAEQGLVPTFTVDR